MNPAREDDPGLAIPVILVPEVRDYVRINAEIVALLDQGHRLIRLEGAEGQRLLAAGLTGSWDATIEIHGRTGPEVAANLHAAGLRIIARGSTLDGAGRGLRAGMIMVDGDAGDGVGYAQTGGTLIVTGNVGHRAGLAQAGGTLIILGSAGRLAGDRQSGGFLFLGPRGAGAYLRRGQCGGHLVEWLDRPGPAAGAAWREVVSQIEPWVDAAIPARP